MSVSSSDSQLSSHAELDPESDCDVDLDSKFLNVDDASAFRYRRKDRSLL